MTFSENSDLKKKKKVISNEEGEDPALVGAWKEAVLGQ